MYPLKSCPSPWGKGVDTRANFRWLILERFEFGVVDTGLIGCSILTVSRLLLYFLKTLHNVLGTNRRCDPNLSGLLKEARAVELRFLDLTDKSGFGMDSR